MSTGDCESASSTTAGDGYAPKSREGSRISLRLCFAQASHAIYGYCRLHKVFT